MPDRRLLMAAGGSVCSAQPVSAARRPATTRSSSTTSTLDEMHPRDRQRPRRGGLESGLALVNGLVELHGRTVRASSEGIGGVAEFIVTLPQEEELPALSKELTRSLGSGHPPRALSSRTTLTRQSRSRCSWSWPGMK
jgi:hypothetical protein